MKGWSGYLNELVTTAQLSKKSQKIMSIYVICRVRKWITSFDMAFIIASFDLFR
jgi:hypothetical protein